MHLIANLRESETADRIWAVLPIEGAASRWGDAVDIDVDLEIDRDVTAAQIVPPGTCCFWCEGRRIVLPFGPTPISLSGESRLVAPANPFADCDRDVSALAAIAEGDAVTIVRAR